MSATDRIYRELAAAGRSAMAGGWRWCALLLAAALLTRLPAFFTSFYSGDEATYSALAVRLLDGALPYLGAVDHKPVGIAILYAGIYSLFGANHLWAVRAALVLAVALTGAVVGLIAERLHGDRSARVAGLLYVLASAWGVPGDVQAANTELFLNLPLALAGLLVADARARGPRRERLFYLAAGLLTAVAAAFKYQAGLAGIAWAVAAAFEAGTLRARASRLALLAAGFAAAAAGYLATFAAKGIWSDFLFWGWGFNFRYITTLPAREMALNGLKYSALVALFWLPILLLVGRRSVCGAAGRVAAPWLGATLAAASVGGRFFPHYFLMALPPLSLLAAAPAREQVARWRPRASAAIGAAFAVLALVAAAQWYALKPRLTQYDRAYRELGAYIAATTAATDRVFVWGNSPEIYFYSDREMGTRFPFCNYQTGKIWGSPLDDVNATGTEAHIVPEAWDELLADLRSDPPSVIVDAGAGRLDRFDRHPIGRYPALASFVGRNYALDRLVGGVPVYRLADESVLRRHIRHAIGMQHAAR